MEQRKPECRYGDACRTRDCRFTHSGGALCKYFPHCTPPPGRVCGFRHPTAIATESTVIWVGLSPALLAKVFGAKRSAMGPRVSALERELSCSLRVDFDHGRITAAPFNVHQDAAVRDGFNRYLDAAHEELKRFVKEEHYMDTTRAVIGGGFEARELLFGDEFGSFLIQHFRDKREMTWMREMLQDWGYRQYGVPVVQYIDIVGRASDKVVVCFVSKKMAMAAFAFLTHNEPTSHWTLTPLRRQPSTETGVTHSSLAGQVKISWAIGKSTGSGMVYFASAVEANMFVRSYSTHRAFRHIRVRLLGNLPDARRRDGEDAQEQHDDEESQQRTPRWLPPLRRELRPGMRNLILFDDAKIREMTDDQAHHLQFGVEIQSGLPLDVDEHALLQFSGAVQCSIKRMEREQSIVQQHIQTDILTSLSPRVSQLVNCLVDGEEAVHFVDQTASREGFVVDFRDQQRMDEVYAAAVQNLNRIQVRLDVPCSQPVRMSVEYLYRTSVLVEVYDCFRKPISKFLASIRNKGVWYTQPETQTYRSIKVIVLRFRSLSRDLLQRAATSLDEIIQCERIDRRTTTMLSSITGRQKLHEWICEMDEDTDPRAFVQFMRKEKTCWVFGEATQRQNTIRSIQELAQSIETNAEILDKIVRVDLSRVGISRPERNSVDVDMEHNTDRVEECLKQLPAMEHLYHYAALGDGNRLVMSGSALAVDAAMAALAEAKYLLRRDRIALAMKSADDDSRPDCGVCMMPADEPVIQFSVCGHSYCRECIEPGVTTTSRLPLRCPIPNCEQGIHIDDIARITKDIDSMVETAVFDYVAKHPDECVVCPKAGCNQILSLDKLERDECGGQFLVCESCAQGYCLVCSATTAQATLRHDHTTCDDFQQSGSTVTDRHVLFIRERLLTLKCPACQSAFLDFDGCTSVRCGNSTCPYYFCANCLAYSSTSSNDTHQHVRECPKNPKPGEYFLSPEQLANVHKKLRIDLLRDYLLSKIGSGTLQVSVLRALTRDLADLGIIAQDIIQAGS